MAKIRRDSKGRALQKGEIYQASRSLYCFTYTDPVGKRRYVYSRNLLDLRDKEKEIRRDSLDGIDSYVRANCTFDFLFERYIATKNNLRSSTRTNYRYTYKRYVKSVFGQKKIGDIKYSDLLYFYQTQLDKGLSIHTVDGMHRVIYSAFKLAVRDDIIRKNPAEGLMAELKASYDSDTAIHPLSHIEETEFLNFLDQPKYKNWEPLFLFMFGTGCRIGEVIGIRWQDIDFENNEISINHDITYGPREKIGFKCDYEAGPPKTKAGIRTIHMMSKVRKSLLEERRQQDELGCYNTSVVDGMSGFIFCNRYGKIHKPSTINRAIGRIVDDHNQQEIVKAAKEDREPVLIPRFSCHVARHTFCSRLCETITNIKLIQQTMGHADVRTTMNIYAEVTKDKSHAVFQEINEDEVL